MLLDFEEVVGRWPQPVNGVLHIGAHTCEEAPIYDRLDVPVLWIEANEDLGVVIGETTARYKRQFALYGRPVTDVDDAEVEFKITNLDSMSSSVFEFGTHPQFSPEIVVVERRAMRTITIDTIMRVWGAVFDEWGGPSIINTLVMDIQGAELLALKGAPEFLKQVDYVYCEVNTDEVYVGCAKRAELINFLLPLGFEYVAESMVPGQGWGDGLFARVWATSE